MRITAFTALILATGLAAAAAEPVGTAGQLPGGAAQSRNATPQQRLSPGQQWVVQQESMALSSPYRLSIISSQVAQERQNRSIRQLPLGRPQRELR